MYAPAWIRARADRFRQSRFAVLRDVVLAQQIRTILDVGGTYAYWREMDWRSLGEVQITLLNLTTEDVPAPFLSIAGDGRDLSRFLDRSFDLAYSNSALGHVGTFTDQQRMASELQRVGARFLLQTPNQHFPIDWRTMLPVFHWLPTTWQAWCFAHLPRVGVYPPVHPLDAWSTATRIRNLTRRELQTLFPESVLARERVCGLTKSFLVHTPDLCRRP